MLATRLRELEAAGVLSRLPLRHNTRAYALTDRGLALREAIVALGRWGGEERPRRGAESRCAPASSREATAPAPASPPPWYGSNQTRSTRPGGQRPQKLKVSETPEQVSPRQERCNSAKGHGLRPIQEDPGYSFIPMGPADLLPRAGTRLTGVCPRIRSNRENEDAKCVWVTLPGRWAWPPPSPLRSEDALPTTTLRRRPSPRRRPCWTVEQQWQRSTLSARSTRTPRSRQYRHQCQDQLRHALRVLLRRQ